MIKNIHIPKHLKFGTKEMKMSCPEKINVIGLDTETVKGQPWTIQFADKNESSLDFVNENNIIPKFLERLEHLIIKEKDVTNVVYGHNLMFDLPVIFTKYISKFVDPIIEMTIGGNVKMKIYAGKFYFAEINFGDTKVRIIDSYRFVMQGMEKACEDLKLDIKKLPTPEGLGEKKLKSREFKDYALNDVRVQYTLGSWIIDRVKEYDVPIPLSIAQFSQYVFKKFFIPEKAVIKFPPTSAIHSSILSYHGGKNGCYVPVPTLLKNVHSFDIASAYPYAMSSLPSFIGGDYKESKTLRECYDGIYTVWGNYKGCQYPNLYTHSFKTLSQGKIDGVCMTSIEIKDALKRKELTIDKIRGHYFVPQDGVPNPLKDFVNHFYPIKEKATDHTERWIAKYILNALYGKFIQANQPIKEEYLKVDTDKGIIKVMETIYKAGGMFNPFIGSLITAFTRVQLHEYEHKYKAIHTATDSIFTKIPIQKVKTGNRLGNLKYEGSGDLLLIRNKFYIHCNIDFKTVSKNIKRKEGEKRIDYKLMGIRKYALHGFQAKVEKLIELWRTKTKRYKFSKMTLTKESLVHHKKGLTPNMFNDYSAELTIDWDKYTEEK